MIGVHLIYLMVISGMLCVMWREHRHRCMFERAAVRDRREIREVAERTACEVAACKDVIKRFPIIHDRHLHLATDPHDN